MRIGDLIAGRFELVEHVATGGMGEVFRARDRSAEGRTVALKRLIPDRNRQELTARFQREATVLSRLSHPCVVDYIAHGRTESGDLFLAMEWVDGIELESWLQERAPVRVEVALGLARRLADAMGAAHRLGIVHRDIKPSNVMLVSGDPTNVRLLDFGIARVEQPEATDRRTQAGLALGTPQYMSPEQARGLLTVDARTDVYSLGCILFELLTGRPPFVGDSALAVLAKTLIETAPRVADAGYEASAELEDLIARMLAKSPSDRPGDGNALVEEIDKLRGIDQTVSVPAATDADKDLSGERQLFAVVLAVPTDREHVLAPHTDDWTKLEADIRARGGSVDSLADGSLTVTVGVGHDATVQAAQVAHCALAVRAIAPSLRISVATGLGVRRELGLLGEVIERAAELLTPADAGAEGIAVDDLTAGLLAGRFAVESSAVSHVLKPHRAMTNPTLLGKSSPFVGRRSLMGRLAEAFHSTVRDHRPAVVKLSGPAGQGKTRVANELLGELMRSGVEYELLTLAGDPMSGSSSFSMLTHALKRSATLAARMQSLGDLTDTLDTEPLLAGLQAHLSRVLSASDLRRVHEFLSQLLHLSVAEPSRALLAAQRDGMLLGDQIRRAVADWFAAEASQRPLVVVVEDAQWGDAASMRAVETALATATSRELPLFIVVLGRPELDEQFPGLFRRHGALELSLAPIPRRACEQLVKHALGDDVPRRQLSELVDRSGGNPLFLEELLRVEVDGPDSTPRTALAIVQARLQRLTSAQRRLLRAASVFGRVFHAAGINTVLGSTGTDAIEAGLEELRSLELVSQNPAEASGGYRFSQHLVREAAYDQLTTADRREGHRRAADWLLEMGESDAGVIAEHFERSEQTRRAAVWYLLAAEQAFRGHDLEAVVGLCDRIQIEELPEARRFAARQLRAEALNWLGRTEDALVAARESTALATTWGTDWFRAQGEVVSTLGKLGRYDDLDELSRVLPSSADRIEPSALGAAVICIVRASVSLLQGGRRDAARRLLDLAAAAQDRASSDDVASVGWLYRGRASHALDRSDPDAYRRFNENAASAFEAIGDHRNAAMPRVNLGYGWILLGQFANAQAALERALGAAQSILLPSVEAFAYVNLQLALTGLGRLTEALDVSEHTLRRADEQNNPRLAGFARIYRALTYIESGDFAAAIEEAKAGETALFAVVPTRIYAQGVLARAYLGANQVDDARRAIDSAMSELDRLGTISAGDAFVRLVFVEVLEASGQANEARAQAMANCERLIDAAASIADDKARNDFLEAVPEHAATIRKAHTLSAAPSRPA